MKASCRVFRPRNRGAGCRLACLAVRLGSGRKYSVHAGGENLCAVAGNNWRKRRGELAEALATETFAEGQTWWRANADTVGTDAYTFSKEAVVLYTMVLAGRGLARGIRVNDVGPGPIDTPILPDFTTEVGADTMKTMIDMVGRSAQPHDIAEAVVQLAEGHIGWLNGQHIIVDGGMMAGFSSGWNK